MQSLIAEDVEPGTAVEVEDPVTGAKRMSKSDYKEQMALRRKQMEEERRAILRGAQRLTASALARRRLAQKRLEHEGLMYHQFRLTRAFVWSYFSLLQWLRFSNDNERLPSIDY